jgi:hypothetical protein
MTNMIEGFDYSQGHSEEVEVSEIAEGLAGAVAGCRGDWATGFSGAG